MSPLVPRRLRAASALGKLFWEQRQGVDSFRPSLFRWGFRQATKKEQDHEKREAGLVRTSMVVCAEDVAIAKAYSESCLAFADYDFNPRCIGRDNRRFQMGVSSDGVSESLAFAV